MSWTGKTLPLAGSLWRKNIHCPKSLYAQLAVRINNYSIFLQAFGWIDVRVCVLLGKNRSVLYTGLLKMIVGVLTTCHTQCTWDRSICIFLFNRTTLQFFVTYLIGAPYVHPLWFYKHQHDNRVLSKLFVACQRWWFQWQFAAILVNCSPSGEMHNYCTPHIIKKNFENLLIRRCNYILLSHVCAWQDVNTLRTGDADLRF